VCEKVESLNLPINNKEPKRKGKRREKSIIK
jgi:hypothetical protein